MKAVSKKRNHYSDTKLVTRSENNDNDLYVEGYFAIFNSETKVWRNQYEQIAKGCFADAIKNDDIRCLFNHDDKLVLGRNTSGTLELHEDSKGLWGRVKINCDDTQAMDIYQRVKRGDISGCSFGFYPTDVKTEMVERDDGSIEFHNTVVHANMDEVSICTYPAYKDTEIQARSRDNEKLRTENIENKRKILRERLKKLC